MIRVPERGFYPGDVIGDPGDTDTRLFRYTPRFIGDTKPWQRCDQPDDGPARYGYGDLPDGCVFLGQPDMGHVRLVREELANGEDRERLDGHLASPEVMARLAALPDATIELRSGTFDAAPPRPGRYEPPVP